MVKVYKLLITCTSVCISSPQLDCSERNVLATPQRKMGQCCNSYIPEIKMTYDLRVTGLTQVVKPIAAVLRISAYACSGVMASPSEHVVINLASM